MTRDLDFTAVPAARRGPRLIAFGLTLAFAATVAAGMSLEAPHRAAIRRLNAAGATVTGSEKGEGAGWLPWLEQPRGRYQVFWKGGFGCLVPPFYAPRADEPRPIEDADLRAVRALGAVTSLDLEDQAIGDAGLAHLRGLKALSSLNLTGTRVTDASLPVLESLSGLRHLTVAETALSPTALEALKAHRPGLHFTTERVVRYKGG